MLILFRGVLCFTFTTLVVSKHSASWPPWIWRKRFASEEISFRVLWNGMQSHSTEALIMVGSDLVFLSDDYCHFPSLAQTVFLFFVSLFICLFCFCFCFFVFFFFFLMRLWSNVLDSIIIFRQIWCVKKWLEGVNISFYTESLLNLISKYYLYLCRGPREHNFFNAFILSHDKLSHFFSLPFAFSLFFSLPFAFSLFSHLTVTPSASSLLFPQISIVKIYWLRCCYT